MIRFTVQKSSIGLRNGRYCRISGLVITSNNQSYRYLSSSISSGSTDGFDAVRDGSSSNNAYLISSILRSTPSVDIPNALNNSFTIFTVKNVEDAMLSLTGMKEYGTVISAFESLMNANDVKHLSSLWILSAALKSYGCLARPMKARSIVSKGFTTRDSHFIVLLLLDCYQKSDRLDLAEKLVFSWIDLHSSNASFKNLKKLLMSTRDVNPLASILGNDGDGTSALAGLNVDDLKKNKPSLEAWLLLIKLYSGRKAWINCMHVIDFIDKNPQLIDDLDSHKSSLLIPISILYGDELTDNDNDDYDCSISRSSTTNDGDRDININIASSSSCNKNDLITFNIYNHTIKALCEGGNFAAAFDLLHLIKRKPSFGVGAEVALLIHLAKILSMPILDTVLSRNHYRSSSSSSSSSKIEEYSPIMLLNDIKDVIVQLIQVNDGRHIKSIRLLLATYVEALCVRGFLTEAVEVVDIVYKSDNGNGKRMLIGSTISTIIHYLSITKDWQQGLVWYSRLADVKDGYVHNRDGTSSLHIHHSDPYHAICSAMRQEGEFEELNKFMSECSKRRHMQQ